MLNHRSRVKKLFNTERGSAIISALFLMGVVAMLAVTMLTRQSIQIRRTEIIFQEERLLAQANWVELWGMNSIYTLMQQLAERGEDFITLDQSWAKPLEEFQQEGVWLSGEIIDLQAQFNINNLLAVLEESLSAEQQAAQQNEQSAESSAQPPAPPSYQEVPEEKNPFDKETPFTTPWMFARLLTNVTSESTSQAQALTENILHWMEPEITEWDNDYLTLAAPYRPAHQALQSLSELRLILNMDNNIINALQPHVNAFISEDVQQVIQPSLRYAPSREANPGQPENQPSTVYINVPAENFELFPINVNTTTAPVLAAVLDIELAQASGVLAARPFYDEEGLQDQLSVLNLTDEAGAAQQMLTITSHYFLVKAVVRDDRRSIVQYSIIKRDPEGNILVIRRVQGEL